MIVAGGAILTEILAFYGLDAIVASERDILHGAALAAAELPEPEEGAGASRRLHLLLTLWDILRPWRSAGFLRGREAWISDWVPCRHRGQHERIVELLEEDDGEEDGRRLTSPSSASVYDELVS